MYYLENWDMLKRAMEKYKKVQPEVTTVTFGQYRVKGSKGNWYNVACYYDAHDRKVVECDCETFDGYVCYHSAAALIRHIYLAREKELQGAPRK
jgi:hypothetical protein